MCNNIVLAHVAQREFFQKFYFIISVMYLLSITRNRIDTTKSYF